MKQLMRLAVMATLAVAGSAFAQEIGSEITPATPPPATQSNQPNDNPYASQARGQPAAMAGEPVALSAGRMSFGIRAGFEGTFTPAVSQVSIPNGTGGTTNITTTSGAAPLLGVSFWVTDGLAIDADLGLALGVLPSGTTAFGFGIKAGISYYFRGPERSTRPFLTVKLGFDKGFSVAGDDFGFGAVLGGGAAYFFSPNFAIDARMLLGVNLGFGGRGLTVIMSTVAPGLGATVFF